MTDVQLLIAIVTIGGTILGTVLTLRSQEKQTAKSSAIEFHRLQKEIEETLWERVKEELADRDVRLDRQSKHIAQLEALAAEQGALLMQHREQIKQLESDKNHWRSRALEAEKAGRARQ
jgi:hypothetical protein